MLPVCISLMIMHKKAMVAMRMIVITIITGTIIISHRMMRLIMKLMIASIYYW